MPKISAVTFLVLLTACATAHAPVIARDISGCYSKTDDMGYNTLELRLKADGSYLANLQGDIGSWGNAIGTWQIDGSKLDFNPSRETERMVGFLHQVKLTRTLRGYGLQPTGWSTLSAVRCHETFAHPNGL
jgi:hypothetical protein